MECTYAPDGRSYEEYVAYLVSLSDTPETDPAQVDTNLEIGNTLFSVAKRFPPKQPDNIFMHASKAARYLMAARHASNARELARGAISLAESVKKNGSLKDLHTQMLVYERQRDSAREDILRKQAEKGELTEDERSAATLVSENGDSSRIAAHLADRRDLFGVRGVVDEDKAAALSQFLGLGIGSMGPKVSVEDKFEHLNAKLLGKPAPKPAPIVNIPSPTPVISADARLSPGTGRVGVHTKVPQAPDMPNPARQTVAPWRYPSAGSPPRRTGLRNLGNTCFMNSILQCMYSLDDLRRHLSKQLYVGDLTFEQSDGSVVNTLSQTMGAMEELSSGVYNPSSLKFAIGRRNESFAGFSQQDAYEFFLSLVNEAHADVDAKRWMLTGNHMVEEPHDFARAANAARRHFRINSLNSIFQRTFMFQTRSVTMCSACGTVSTIMNTELGLELPFPRGGQQANIVDLQAMIGEYCRSERFVAKGQNDSNGYKCDRCRCYVSATRQTTIFSLPQTLVLTFKRFRHSGDFSDKISTCVAFPETLSLAPFCSSAFGEGKSAFESANIGERPKAPLSSVIIHNLLATHARENGLPEPSWAPPRLGDQEVLYQLKGVVNHRGNIHGGHYTADVCDSAERCWTNISDERVLQADKPDRGLAFMLFYSLS